jgi:hypothetical protein
MKYDANTTQVFFEYITNNQFGINDRIAAALCIKNKVKKAFGQHQYSSYEKEKQQNEPDYVAGSEEDPATHIDADGISILQNHLVGLVMSCPEKVLYSVFLECIALMSKRFVQQDWPGLIPELCKYLTDPSLPESNVH